MMVESRLVVPTSQRQFSQRKKSHAQRDCRRFMWHCRMSATGRLRTRKWQALICADASRGVFSGRPATRGGRRQDVGATSRSAWGQKPTQAYPAVPYPALFFSPAGRCIPWSACEVCAGQVRVALMFCPSLTTYRRASAAYVRRFEKCAHRSAEIFGRASRDGRESPQSEKVLTRVPVHGSGANPHSSATGTSSEYWGQTAGGLRRPVLSPAEQRFVGTFRVRRFWEATEPNRYMMIAT